MNSRSLRRRRSWAQLAAVGSLLVGATPAARAGSPIVAVRGVPSSLSADFGPAVALPGGGIAAPTGAGVDFYDLSQPTTPLLAHFRTAGPVSRASAAGTTVLLFAGARGIVAVDASDPSNPRAAGSIGDLGDVTLGAAAPAGGGVLAGSGSTLQFLSWDPASGFTLRRTLVYADGRTVGAVAAQGDSFLVASNRGFVPTRLILTLYRMRAGADPESLDEFAFNGHAASDAVWRGRTAFLADGNFGVLAVDTVTRAIRSITPVPSTKLVRSLDANDSVLVAAAEGRTLARFARTGAAGDTLVAETTTVLSGDPAYVRLSDDWIVSSTYDQIAAAEPDPPGRSLLELESLSAGPTAGPLGGTGRVRRVAVRNGLAYVADYSGGLRIYRAGGTDSSLVGVVPPTGYARPVDVAVDPTLPLVYLASGPGGLEVVQVGDPGVPLPVASMAVDLASAVAPVGPNLIAVAYRGLNPGLTFVQVDYDPADSSVVLTPRGSVGNLVLFDPRAIAARDTVLFVADDRVGVVSIGFGNPDLPARIGSASLAAARDLDLAGTQLLVATRANGLQVVDVTLPTAPILRSQFAAPPLVGVARNGASAIVFTGGEALVVDVTDPRNPVSRGPILPPGIARDGAWVGDTLLIAASYGLERYMASPTPAPVPALDARLDAGSATQRAVITWAPLAPAGLVGFNLHRDLIRSDGIDSDPPAGRRVNRDLLPPGTVSAVDDSLTSGLVHRYRLEAFFADGSTVKVAEGTLAVSGAPLVGRVYPNPFRPGTGAAARLSYRIPQGAGSATLTLRVFDVSGRLVRTTSEPAAAVAGFGAIAWDGRDRNGRAVPSGVYYLRLSITGGARLEDSRAVILLR